MDDSRPLIDVEHVTFGYDTEVVLRDVSLRIHQGDFLGVIGPNGGGKTTLLRLILGLLEPWSGAIRQQLSGRKGAIGYVPQFAAFDKNFPLGVGEVVRMGRLALRSPLRRYNADDERAVEQTLDRFRLQDVVAETICDLSGGQLQRVLIARALVAEPELLLLDEPLASIDAETREVLFQTLAQLNRKIPIVVVTHDLTPFGGAVKQIACVNRKLYFHPHGKLTAEMLEEVYGCPVELVTHGVPHRVLPDHGHGG